jgi:hypothetical protein
MHVAIHLSPATEERQQREAEQTGQDVNQLAGRLLARALADLADDLSPDEILEIRRGIRRGYDASIEGRGRPLEEYTADVLRAQAARNA